MVVISKLISNIKNSPHLKVYIGFLSLLVLGLTVVGLKIILIKLNESIKKNKYKIRKVKQVNKKLRARIAKLSQKQRLERILSSSKGLHPPDVGQIAVLRATKVDSALKKQGSSNSLNRVIAAITGTFKKIAPGKEDFSRSGL